MWNWLKNIIGNNERPDAPASEIPNPTAQNTTEIPLLPVQELTDEEKKALIKRLEEAAKKPNPNAGMVIHIPTPPEQPHQMPPESKNWVNSVTEALGTTKGKLAFAAGAAVLIGGAVMVVHRHNAKKHEQEALAMTGAQQR